MMNIKYPNVRWTCKLCGNCCGDMPGRERKILLTEKDLKRIKVSSLVTDNSFFKKNMLENGPYKYEMVKTNGNCIFLSSKRCSIYQNRPMICRFYPFTLIEDKGYIFDVDHSCQGIGKGITIDEKYFKKLIEEAFNTWYS